jgi:hypothetical protein
MQSDLPLRLPLVRLSQENTDYSTRYALTNKEHAFIKVEKKKEITHFQDFSSVHLKGKL